ncbi:5673_t:CDS:2, partial [Entrophospora sp. SA101]
FAHFAIFVILEFLLIGETKLPFARTKGLHEKLIRELNNATNDLLFFGQTCILSYYINPSVIVYRFYFQIVQPNEILHLSDKNRKIRFTYFVDDASIQIIAPTIE